MDARHYHARKLVEAREAMGKTQQEIAGELNVDRQTIYRMEAGVNASYERLVKLCAFYGLPMTSVVIDYPEIQATAA